MKLRPPLIAIALAALSIGVPAVSAAAASHPASHPAGHPAQPGAGAGAPRMPSSTPLVTGLTSPNWAGWMDLGIKTAQLYKVTAQFQVPAATCPVADATAYFWVGLDGWTDKTVEQAGVAAYCNQKSGSGYKAEYFDWYEMYPNKPVAKFFVHPGDTIVATVSYDAATAKYNLQIADKSAASSSFKVAKACPSGSTCDKSSAEVITEDPGGGPASGQYLANFKTVTFSHVQVTSRNGTVGGLGANSRWSANKIVMEYQSKVMARPSARNATNTGFSVAFKSKG
jgi:hypothetical protein